MTISNLNQSNCYVLCQTFMFILVVILLVELTNQNFWQLQV